MGTPRKHGLRGTVDRALKERALKNEIAAKEKEKRRQQLEQAHESARKQATREIALQRERRAARREIARPTGRLSGAREEARDVRGRGAAKVSRAASNAARNLRIERQESAPSMWDLPGTTPDKSPKAADAWNFAELGGPLFDFGMPPGNGSAKKKENPLELPSWF